MFYTYLWLREDGTPYYVGKGTKNRAFKTQNHLVPRPFDSSKIIVQEWPSESDAFEAEKFLIAFYGRKDLRAGCLQNRTDGGEGAVALRTTRWKLRQSEAATRRYTDPQEKVKTSAALKGHKISEAARSKISEWNKVNSPKRGKKVSEETKARMRLGWIKRRQKS